MLKEFVSCLSSEKRLDFIYFHQKQKVLGDRAIPSCMRDEKKGKKKRISTCAQRTRAHSNPLHWYLCRLGLRKSEFDEERLDLIRFNKKQGVLGDRPIPICM